MRLRRPTRDGGMRDADMHHVGEERCYWMPGGRQACFGRLLLCSYHAPVVVMARCRLSVHPLKNRLRRDVGWLLRLGVGRWSG